MAFLKRFPPLDLVFMGLGCLAFGFIGWRYNMAFAALIAPPALMRFFRGRDRWGDALLAYPLLGLGTAFSFLGAWDLEVPTMILSICLRPFLFVLPLFLDRWARRRLPHIAATLVFPAAMVAVDFVISFTPFATVLSGVVGLFGARELAQASSLAGLWGLGFIIWWLAPALNALEEARFDARAAGAAFLLPLACAGATLAYGAFRIATVDYGAPTVRIAGISAEHPRNYWTLIDRGSPRAEVQGLRAETAPIEDRLFNLSAKATVSGAKIIVWSEGACVLDQEQEPSFIERAAGFARDHRVYLAAAVLVFHYGSGISDNKVLMFTPNGNLAFSYVKTVSWYPTDSDGIPKVIDTPYGRLGAAICFDMDDPRLTRRLKRAEADIVLVPAYDTERIRPFHSEVGLFSAIENGYSIFRQVAEGSSMAVDGRGIVRGFQDYFSTPERLMVADLPIKGEWTLAAVIGDVFAWIDLIVLSVLVAFALRRKVPRNPVGLMRTLKWALSRAIR